MARMRRGNTPNEYVKLESRSMLSADGIIVADYRDDFQDSDTAWNYEFNSSDTLLDLETQPLGGDGVLRPSQPTNDTGALRLTAVGGHPGKVSNRYAIASWTVPQSGSYAISESFLHVPSFDFALSDGVELRVFVNSNSPLQQSVVGVNETGYFDMEIGFLNEGDVIRVAFGANGNHAFDRFETDFSIQRNDHLSQSLSNFRTTVDENANSDSQQRVSKSKWQTLWNAPEGWSTDSPGDQRTGAIENVASYRPLSRANDRMLTPDGESNFSNAPQYFLRFDGVGGHTGIGFSDNASFQDRYVIAAHTVERSGRYFLTDTFLETIANSRDGVEVRVFVNGLDNELLRTIVGGNQSDSFDVDFDLLRRGDTVYVAFGPGDNHVGDRFKTDFSLVRELPRAEPLRSFTAENVLFARDFGAVPNDRISDVAGFLGAFEAAKESGTSTRIVLEEGIYNFYSADLSTIGNPRYFFTFLRQSNIEIDGQGATLIVENNDRGLFRILNSENVILRDFTIDYAQLVQTQSNPANDIYLANTFSQGRILSTDPQSRSFVFEVDANATVEPDRSFVAGDTAGVQAWGYLLDGESGSRLKYNTRWHYTTMDLERVANRQYRITVNNFHNIEPGDRYVLQRRTNVGAIGVFAGASQVSVIDVTIHSSPSAFITAKEAELVNVIRSDAEVLASAGRWRSINADAIHGQSMRQGFWVEDSNFDAVGDDIMNFYTVPSVIVGKPAAKRLTLAAVNLDTLRGISSGLWQVGDIATFVNPVTGETIQESRVVEIESVNFGHPDFGVLATQTLTFSEDITGIRFASGTGVNDAEGFRNDTAVYNSSTSKGFLVQGTKLSNARRYGQFVMADNVQLVDSTYNGLTDSAIAGHNESNWPIGLYSSNVLVQNNRFLRNGFSQRYFEQDYLAGVVAFNMDRLGHQFVERAEYGISRIEIVDNVFRGWGKTAISAKNVSGLRIEGNEIFSPLAYPDGSSIWFGIDAQFNRDTNVIDNELFSNVPFINNVNNETIRIE